MGKSFDSEKMEIPEPSTVDGCEFDPLPYYLVGNAIFPLKTWLMWPYPGVLTEKHAKATVFCTLI